MTRAAQIVEALLDEAFEPDYTEPSGRNYAAERAKIKSDIAQERTTALKRQERETGLETEREMRDQGWSPEEEAIRTGEATFGRHGKKARDYFSHPNRKRWPKMRELQVGKVTGGGEATKPAQPSMQIKGRQKYQPPHQTMPAPWKNWR